MIKYHGTPFSQPIDFEKALKGNNALIPFPRKDDYKRAVQLCDRVILDNGAYSLWKRKINIDWNKYYEWVYSCYEDIENFFIPDVIDGTEEENDQLISDFIKNHPSLISKAIPVYHVAESFDRLIKLINEWDYIALGSSGEYHRLGTKKWFKRMNQIMRYVCDKEGKPKVKIHMLRCLDKRLFTLFPFYSGDSTNLGRNHKRDGLENKLKVEFYNSPTHYSRRKTLKKRY